MQSPISTKKQKKAEIKAVWMARVRMRVWQNEMPPCLVGVVRNDSDAGYALKHKTGGKKAEGVPSRASW